MLQVRKVALLAGGIILLAVNHVLCCLMMQRDMEPDGQRPLHFGPWKGLGWEAGTATGLAGQPLAWMAATVLGGSHPGYNEASVQSVGPAMAQPPPV